MRGVTLRRMLCSMLLMMAAIACDQSIPQSLPSEGRVHSSTKSNEGKAPSATMATPSTGSAGVEPSARTNNSAQNEANNDSAQDDTNNVDNEPVSEPARGCRLDRPPAGRYRYDDTTSDYSEVWSVRRSPGDLVVRRSGGPESSTTLRFGRQWKLVSMILKISTPFSSDTFHFTEGVLPFYPRPMGISRTTQWTSTDGTTDLFLRAELIALAANGKARTCRFDHILAFTCRTRDCRLEGSVRMKSWVQEESGIVDTERSDADLTYRGYQSVTHRMLELSDRP